MSHLVARTGRHQQRYDGGCRLVAGCIPFRYKNSDTSNDDSGNDVEVFMISSQSGPGLLFPKKHMKGGNICFFSSSCDDVLGGWENDETVEEAAAREAVEEAGVRGNLMDLLGYYKFKSKTHRDEFCPEGLCKAAMFALLVTEELDSWPEKSIRVRYWLTVSEAAKNCRHAWMRDALVDGFLKWHGRKLAERDGSD